jgi:mannosyltransferase
MRATPAGQQNRTNAEDSPVPSAETAGAARTAGWLRTAARYAPVIAASATMAVYGSWGLARDSAMGNDEVASRFAALLSLGDLVRLLRRVDIVHGLYYLLLHGWMAVGTSPAVMRIPSVIAMTAAAALMVIIVRRLTGSGWAGLFSGLIVATAPSVSYYAQTARSYALVFACVLAETLALLRALEAEQASAAPARVTHRWAIYGALVTLGGYLNELSLLVLAAHAITVLLARYGRRAFAHWAITSALACTLAAPVVAVSILQRGSASWIPAPDFNQVRYLYHDYFGATFASAVILVVCAVVAVLPPGPWWRRRRGRTGARTSPKTASPWRSSGGASVPSVGVPLVLVPAGLLLLESVIAPPLYQERYVQYGEAGAALLAGAGLYRIGRWLAGGLHRPELLVVPGVVVCLATLLLQFRVQHDIRTPASRQFNFGGPAFYVGAHARRGDGVLFMNSFYRKAELGYPEQFRKTSDFALAVSPVDAPYQGIDKPFPAIRRLMLRHRRIWVIGYRPSPLLPAGPLREESLVLWHDFVRVKGLGYRGIWLSLWIRVRAAPP